jgi:hypothetical protein
MRPTSGVAAAATVVVSLSLVLSNYGSAETTSPQAYAHKVCPALATWATRVGTEQSKFRGDLIARSDDLTAAKAALLRLLGDSVSDTDSAISAIRRAGAPSATNGAKFAKLSVKALESIRTTLVSAKTKARKLATTDPTQFRAAVRSLASSIDTAGEKFLNQMNNVRTLDKSGRIGRALSREPSCAVDLGGVFSA